MHSFEVICNQKTSKDVKLNVLQNWYLGISNIVRLNKRHFWNIETKLDKTKMFLLGNFEFEKSTYLHLIWPGLDLSSGQIRKWMPPSNSTSEMTHNTCVARQSCNILIWRPYLTRPWPLLSTSPNHICYLLHLFGLEVSWQSLDKRLVLFPSQ